MSDEATTVAAETSAAPEPSLRDELQGAWDKMNADPAQEQETVQEPQQPELDKAAPATPARDEQGRFAKKEGDQEASPDGKEPAKTEPAAGEPEKPEDGKQERYAGPPPGWSVAAKAAFDELPDPVKQAISKREEEIDRGFAKLKEYKELEPYSDLARQHNVKLSDMMQRYYAADQYLQKDPVNAILWLCQNYGVDPRRFAQGGQQEQPQQPQQIDPAMQPLLQKINSLEEQLGRVQSLEQSFYSDKLGQLNNQVERFFADPKNRYAENVADQMVALIQQANASGQPVDLAQIYETACYMNPDVRQQLISERVTADQRQKAETAKQTVDQARAAGASITGGPSASTPTAEPDTENLRALLESNYAALAGRT